MRIPDHTSGAYPLHAVGPLSKLVMLISVSLLGMVWNTVLLQAVLLMVLILAARLLAGVSLPRQFKAMSFLVWMGLPYFVLTLLAVRTGSVWREWGPLVITYEGWNTAGALTLRMFVLFLASFIYIATTNPRDFVQAVHQRLRVPYRFAFGLSIALTFLPLLEEEGKVIAAARRVRGSKPPRGLGGKARWWGGYAQAVLVNAIRRVQQTASAMEGRGFGAYTDRTYLRPVKASPAGLGWASALAATALMLAWAV
ncbi:energy-coupling factor transporter transmembrane protein EcfT [Paenibacillus sp. P96]|uniref:Energy-coupling factor transporter transmembrane protein EcfT n=1 Tax=Paenibacillus zeirhizosphaerae TaxID=2987519 RepID=A0ABT9FLJ7_9BACL|nr:energy-coupling factor transporter transmembrane component T [Paenibacillus sp. P96]MDP4095605.1 energy-coupling factor transporter transmembrane protein EcfT [Paenibacillus sp. P96]